MFMIKRLIAKHQLFTVIGLLPSLLSRFRLPIDSLTFKHSSPDLCKMYLLNLYKCQSESSITCCKQSLRLGLGCFRLF